MSFGAGESAWRKSTPGQWMLDSAQAAESIGRNFGAAFNASAGRAQDSKQSDAKLAEEKRQFDAQHPPMPSARDGSDQPTWLKDSNTTMNGPQGNTTASTGPGAPANGWQQYKFNTPTEAIGGVLGAKNVAEAANIRQANADWEANPNYRKWMDDAFKAPQARESAFNSAERVKIAAATAQNHTVASQILVKDATDFNKRVGTIDPESRAQIIGMEKNKDGTISPNQWRALSTAEESLALSKENERKQAEIEAMQRGDVQRTVITDKGVTRTFTPQKPDKTTDPDAEPKTKVINGVTLAWMPGSKALHEIKPGGERAPATAGQASQFAKTLFEANDPDYKEFSTMAKDMFRSGFKAPAPIGTNAAPAKAAPKVADFDFVPGKGLVPSK